MMPLDQTDALLGLALSTVALLAVAAGWLRWIRPRVHRGVRTWVAVRDSLVGREVQTESTTGRVIAPALPGIGLRLENIETSMARVADLLESQQRQDHRLEILEHGHDNHEHRIKQLEDQCIERIAAKAESVAAWRAVEKIADQGATVADDVLDDVPEID
jgi:cell division protein FtsB